MYNRLFPFAFPLAILDKAPSVALQCCCGVLSWLTLSQDTCAASSVVLLSQAPCRAELAVQGGMVAGAAAEEMESGGSSGAAAGEPFVEEVIDKSFRKGACRALLCHKTPQNTKGLCAHAAVLCGTAIQYCVYRRKCYIIAPLSGAAAVQGGLGCYAPSCHLADAAQGGLARPAEKSRPTVVAPRPKLWLL